MVFPDVELDLGIISLTAGQGHILWGAEDVAGRLAGFADEVGINYPPSARRNLRCSSIHRWKGT